MLEFSTQETSEAKLAALLGELLEGEGAGEDRGTAPSDIPAEIAEMRDMARLLRAASQSVPLPEGRLAVRRALLATLEPRGSERIPARAAWRRTGRWLGVAAMLGLVVAAFGLGAGLLDHVGSPSNPLYGLRRAIDRVRFAFVPGQPEGGQPPFVTPQPQIPETGAIPPSGVAPAGVSGYPLKVLFTGATIPSAPGQEVTVRGRVGGLPVTLSFAATGGCPVGKDCGDFEAWVTPLRGTKASPEFGQMRGTYICSAGKCMLTPVSKTGVFNTTSAFVLQWNASGEFAGLVETGFASLGDWVGAVAQVAEKLNGENLLPPGVTVRDLVRDATNNGSVPQSTPQGRTGGRTPNGIANFQGVGAPTGTGDLGGTTGIGMGNSPSPGAGGSSGGSAVTVSTTSTGVTAPGATVPTTGTTSGSVSTPGASGTTGTTSGSVSGGTSPGGSTVSGSGSATGSAGSSGASVSGGVSVNGGSAGAGVSGGASVGGGTSSGGTSSGGTSSGGTSSGGTSSGGTSSGGTSSGGTSSGGTSSGGTSSGGTSSGGTSSGGGISVGIGGIGISIGAGGISVGVGGGTSSGGGGTSSGGLGTK